MSIVKNDVMCVLCLLLLKLIKTSSKGQCGECESHASQLLSLPRCLASPSLIWLLTVESVLTVLLLPGSRASLGRPLYIMT